MASSVAVAVTLYNTARNCVRKRIGNRSTPRSVALWQTCTKVGDRDVYPRVSLMSLTLLVEYHRTRPCWPSLTERRDHLKYLRYSMRQAPQTGYGTSKIQVNLAHFVDSKTLTAGTSRIILQNFTQCATQPPLAPPYPLPQHRARIWKRVNGIWGPRVDACVKGAQRHPKRPLLVEGAFAFGSDHALYVLATVICDQDRLAEDPYRYTIINSVFRLG